MAETGNLGDLASDEVPGGLRVAVENLLSTAEDGLYPDFETDLLNACVQHFGVSQSIDSFIQSETDDFLDFLEIIVDEGGKPRTSSYGYGDRTYRAIPNVEPVLNDLCERHRFGFRIEGGEVHKIGSPALDVHVVGPALQAVQRSGWEEVERTYKEALLHQRGGETDDALTSANAAVEAALKACGMKGSTLGDLAKDFKRSTLVPGYLTGVPETLDTLLNRLMALRSKEGDAHGKSPGAAEPPQELADLAIHLAGAFIVYLSKATAP